MSVYDEDEEDAAQDFSQRRTLRPVGTTAARRRNRRESVAGAFGSPEDLGPQRGRRENREDPRHASRISNQLRRHGRTEDATTQTDSRTVLDTLPSERRIGKLDGYGLRKSMESVMPYQKGSKSLALEQRELARLTLHPTLRELKSINNTESLRNFRINVGRKAREMRKMERKSLGFFRRILFDLRTWYHQESTKRHTDLLPIWRGEITFVERVFGGSHSAFFSFSRWAWLLNLAISILTVFFIVLIGMIGESWKTMKIDFFPFVPSWRGTVDSFFYLGGYGATMLDGVYNMSVAYLLVIFVCFLISFATIIASLRRIYLLGNEASTNIKLGTYSPFTAVIFTSWDFSLASETGVHHYRHAVATALRTLLTKEQTEERNRRATSGWNLARTLFIRLMTNAFVLATLCVEAYVIFVFISSDTLNTVVFGSGYQIRTTPFVVSAFNLILPVIFDFISRFERYNTEFYRVTVTIARSYLVRLASVYVLLFGFIDLSNYGLSGTTSGSQDTCWETKLGQEFYQLIWTNVILNIVVGLGWPFVQTHVYRFFKKTQDRYYVFDIPANVLDIIYEQSLIWIGMLFCPLIPLFSLLMQVASFYSKYVALRVYAKHPDEIYSSSLMSKAFLAFLFLTLVLSAAPIGYAVTQ